MDDYPWMSENTVRLTMQRAHRIAKEKGVPVWLTRDTLEHLARAGVEPGEYMLDERGVGPTVKVAPDPFERGYLLTVVLVK